MVYRPDCGLWQSPTSRLCDGQSGEVAPHAVDPGPGSAMRGSVELQNSHLPEVSLLAVGGDIQSYLLARALNTKAVLSPVTMY